MPGGMCTKDYRPEAQSWFPETSSGTAAVWFSPFTVLGKRYFEKCYASPWLLSHVALSTEFFSDRILSYKLVEKGDFPGGPVVKNLLCNAGAVGLIPGWGRSHMPQSNIAQEPQLESLCAAMTDPSCHR